MPTEDAPPSGLAKAGKSRVSIACVPCRNRHVRCDAARPHCRRCSSGGKECYYARSRRGGLDRAALAARRARKEAEAAENGGPTGGQETGCGLLAAERRRLGGFAWPSPPDEGATSGSEAGAGTGPSLPLTPLFDMSGPLDCLSATYGNDPLVDLYYKHFHGFHPCVMPQWHLHSWLQDPAKRATLDPLVAVLRFIGSIYGRSSGTPQLKGRCRNLLSHAQLQLPIDPKKGALIAQSRLLFSIALYWSRDMDEARTILNQAINDALRLGMHHRNFARQYGGGDPVIEESWRRTWWQLYIVDAYHAAIVRTPNFIARVDATADLPCEESEYESGSIPVPKTVQDFDNREFVPDDYVYSSFAYLVGATRCVASAVDVASQGTSPKVSTEVVEAVDSMADGWFLLLPESKRQVMGEDGVIDELLFQAQLGLHASIVGIHRPYSTLLFNPLEVISSCTTGPPDSVLTGDLANVHTIRCLKSIEAQIRLMALPARPFCHTPFVICMMTSGTIPLLAACRFLFASGRLEIARHQIKMSIGCLKAMAEVWPQAAVQVREIQMIAQEVLGQASKEPQVLPELGAGDNSDGHGSGSSTTVGSFDMRADGAFPFDLFLDGLGDPLASVEVDDASHGPADVNLGM